MSTAAPPDPESDPRADLVVYYDGGTVINGDREIDTLDTKTIPFHFELAAVPTEIRQPNERPQGDIVFGINQSVAYSQPSFTPSLEVEYRSREQRHSQISKAFDALGHDFSIVCNLTCPNIDFQDKGKQSFDTEPFTEVIESVVGKAVRKIERDIRSRLTAARDDPPTPEKETLDGKAPPKFIKTYFFDNFWGVYNKATNNGQFDIEVRQFLYAMRAPLLNAAKRRGYKYSVAASVDDPKPFRYTDGRNRTLVGEFEEEQIGYRLIQRDERGFFVEPHSGKRVRLGSAAVDDYEPDLNQYNALLFIEKTGFIGTIEQLDLARKYDVGVVNAKGYATGAARDLIETIQTTAAKTDGHDAVPMYALTDFDIAGLGIAADAKDTDELSAVDVLDVERIGIALDDIDEWNLTAEPADYNGKTLTQLDNSYRDGNVSAEQYQFLMDGDGGQRVEINALTPVEFGEYIVQKFDELGIEKVTPDEDDIDTPDSADPEKRRDETVRQRVGDYVIETLWEGDDPEALCDRALPEEVPTPEDIAEDLEAADIPTGDEHRTEVHKELTDRLADHPPEHWNELNRELLDDYEDTQAEIIDDFEDDIGSAIDRWLTEEVDATVELTETDDD